MHHYVYETRNTGNGMIYVGVRSSRIYPEEGWAMRFRDRYVGSGRRILGAVRGYGIRFFKRRTLGVFATRLAAERFEGEIVDQAFLDRDDTYNLAKGGGRGALGLKRSEEQKRQISKAHKGKTLSAEHKRRISELQTGRPHSEETKRKIAEASKGRSLTEEARQKISKAHKGRVPHNKGKPCSEETKRKISEARKGQAVSEETKQKLSAAFKGRAPHNKGKSPSEETKQKISKASKERVSSRLRGPDGKFVSSCPTERGHG